MNNCEYIVNLQGADAIACLLLSWSRVCSVQATSQLVNALKSEAESQVDSEQQKKLLAAAKLLADATARMVEAAKVHIALLATEGRRYVTGI